MNLRPWRLYTKDGTPEPGHRRRSSARSKRVMKRDPESPRRESLLHSRRRSVEVARARDCRRPAASNRSCLAPDTSSTCPRTSISAPASTRSRRRAMPMPRRWTKSISRPPAPTVSTPTMYYGHNLQFESAAAMFAGNLAQARAAAQRTVKLADPIADQMVMIEPFAAQELTVLVRFGQWPAILETKAPPRDARDAERALSLRARRRAGRTGKVTEAEADLAALKAAVGETAQGRDGRSRELGALMSPPWRSRISPRASPRRRATRPRAIKGFTAAVGARRSPRLQRAARLAESRARALGAVLLKAGPVCRSRARVPRRSDEEHRQSAIALRAVSCARGPEKVRRHRNQGVVRQGLGRRRRDARRRPVRRATLIYHSRSME